MAKTRFEKGSRAPWGLALAAVLGIPSACGPTVARALEGDPAVAPAVAPEEAPATRPLRPPAEREPPYWGGWAHLDFVIPMLRGSTCPDDAACVLEGGTGIDLGIERRFPAGLSVGIGYAAYFMDGGGVFEIGVLQFLGARLRYGGLQDRRIHPYVVGGANLVTFGETFDLQTVGAGIDVELGVDVELDPAVRLRFSAPTRWFVLTAFTTSNDGVRRADGFGIEAVLALRVGLVILEVP